jgi:hypothetical protein
LGTQDPAYRPSLALFFATLPNTTYPTIDGAIRATT